MAFPRHAVWFTDSSDKLQSFETHKLGNNTYPVHATTAALFVQLVAKVWDKSQTD